MNPYRDCCQLKKKAPWFEKVLYVELFRRNFLPESMSREDPSKWNSGLLDPQLPCKYKD